MATSRDNVKSEKYVLFLQKYLRRADVGLHSRKKEDCINLYFNID